MPKPNYQFEKRQRDLEKKRKQEEKRQRKLASRNPPDGVSPQVSTAQDKSTDTDDAGTTPGT